MDNRLYPVLTKHRPKINGLIEDRLKWEAYKPEDRNFEVRDKIEGELSLRTLQDHGPLNSGARQVSTASGMVFFLGALALFVATYMVFF